MEILVLTAELERIADLEATLRDRGHAVTVLQLDEGAASLCERTRPTCVLVDFVGSPDTARELTGRLAGPGLQRGYAVLGIVREGEASAAVEAGLDDFLLDGQDAGIVEARLDLIARRVRAAAARHRAEEALAQSNASLAALIENVDDFVLFGDRDAKPIFFNSAYAEVMNALLGIEMRPGLQPHALLTDLEARGLWDSYHERVLAGERFRAEYAHPLPNGQKRYFEVSYSPVISQGEVVGFSELTREVTERKRVEEAVRRARDDLEAAVAERTRALQDEIRARRETEEALRRSEELYRGVFDTATFAILLWDVDCRVRAWNRSAEKVFGWTAEEAVGRTFFELIVPEAARAQVEEVVAGLLDGDLPSRSTNGNVTKSGELLLCEWNNVPHRDPDGRIVGVLSLGQDVTERRRMEERLRQAEKLEAIGRLAGGVAHDFNNQLVGIMGNADLLLAHLAEPRLRTFAQSIVDASTRSAELISELLTFARRKALRAVPVDLHATIGDVVTLLERSIDKRIQIDLDLMPAPPPITLGDPVQLENALLNLALNARDAMAAGGVLTFSTRVVTRDELSGAARDEAPPAQARYVRIGVRDSGTGMDVPTQEHVFEPFFTTKPRGTGMGLAVVYGTVRGHRGFVQVHSEPGRGTLFELDLPLVAATPSPAEVSPPDLPVTRAVRVLMVDDEASVLEPASEMLRMLGHSVTAYLDGDEAVQRYQEDPQAFDLVIVDLVMPRMSGTEVRLALEAANPDVKVLLTSGYSSQALPSSEGDAPSHFLQKPYRLSALAEAVQALIEA